MAAETMTTAFIRAGVIETAGNKDLADDLTDTTVSAQNPQPRNFAAGGLRRSGVEL